MIFVNIGLVTVRN